MTTKAVRDDYYVLMWVFYAPLFSGGPEKARKAIERFRELGCNGGMCMASSVNAAGYMKSLEQFGLPPQQPVPPELGAWPFLENDFPFYLANMCRPLYWKWDQAKPVFRKQYEAFARDRDRQVFVRIPCVNNPAVAEAQKTRLEQVMDGLRDARHLSLLYDLRDEPSITGLVLASDSCFCDHCMSRMREWLKGRYGGLAELNSEWGTAFEAWDQVEPLTTLEAAERRAAGNWNFAPWADHRTFMNETFITFCSRAAAQVRAADPDGLVGLAGTQCPSVFGGYDFSELVPVLDWAEPYDFGNSVDCFRSFKPRRHFPLLKTIWLNAAPRVVEAMLWRYVFQSGGDSGAIIWSSQESIDDRPEGPEPTDKARQFAGVFAELRCGAPRLLQQADELNSPVAVHYSQSSINADFITSAPGRWQSVAASEPERFRISRCRAAWWKLLEDRGLRPVFMSSRQIESGELLRRGIRLLVLPRSIAIGDAEAAAMGKFVEAGGVLAADSFAGRMDEHCRERPSGALDDLFGVRRLGIDNYHASTQRASLAYDVGPGARPRWGQGPLRTECSEIEECIEPRDGSTVMGCSEYSDSPIGIMSQRGRGRAILFNCAPLAYLEACRRISGGQAYQEFFGHIADLAGVEPELKVRRHGENDLMPGWRVWSFVHGAASYFGLVPDMEITQDVLGAIESSRQEGASRRVQISLPVSGHIYEVRSGRYLGAGNEVGLDVEPGAALLLAAMRYMAAGLELELAGGRAVARLKTDEKADVGEHVFRFDVLDSAGRRLPDRGANVVAPGGQAEWKPEGGLPVRGRLACRDVATGVSAEVRLT